LPRLELKSNNAQAYLTRIGLQEELFALLSVSNDQSLITRLESRPQTANEAPIVRHLSLQQQGFIQHLSMIAATSSGESAIGTLYVLTPIGDFRSKTRAVQVGGRVDDRVHTVHTLGTSFMPAGLRRSGLQRPGDLVSTEDDAGRQCLRADEFE
jgi:hypothetical protein